jgi:divalent metal cation (Fe/Co/Zn/Cd) transporter
MFIIWESYQLLRKAYMPLLDVAWNDEEIQKLKLILNDFGVKYHDVRTRLAGNYRFIDIHVEMPKDVSVGNAHEYCDRIEEELMGKYENLTVTIHIEPS